MLEMYPGIENTDLFHVLRDCLEQQSPREMENQFTFPDGTLGWFELSIQPVRQGLLILSWEITERKQAEEQLREDEARFRGFLNAAPDAMLIVNQAGQIMLGNTQAEKVFGYSSKELLGQQVELLIPKQFHTRHSTHLTSFFSNPRQRIMGGGIDLFGRRKDGSEFPVEISLSHHIVNHESVVLAAVRDITERKQVDEKIRQSEAQYRYLFENNPHPMWAYDRKTLKFLAVNSAAIEKYGYGREEFLAMTIADIRPGEDVGRLMENLAESRPDLQHSGTWRHRLKSGEVIDVQISSHTLEIGQREAALVVAQDVTERKRAELLLQQRVEDLALINAINESVNRGESLEKIIQTLSFKAGQIFDSRDAAIYLSAPDHQHLILQHLTLPNSIQEKVTKLIGRSIPAVQLPIQDGNFLSKILQSEQGVIIDNPQTIQAWIAEFTETSYLPAALRPILRKLVPQIYKLINVKSVISIPLKSGETLVGLMEIASEHLFTLQDLERLQNIRAQLTEIILRKQAEEALRQSEEKYRQLAGELDLRVQKRTAEVMDLYDNAPCGYHSLDENGNFVRINQTELNWLGYLREEVIGHPLAKFLSPNSLKIFQEVFPAFKQRGWAKDLELELLCKDGSLLPVMLSATAIYDENGKYLMSRSTLFDLTDLRQAEQALRESEDRYRQAISAANAVPYSMEYASNRYLFIGEGIEQITGYAPHEFSPSVYESLAQDAIMLGELAGLRPVEAASKIRSGDKSVANLIWRSDVRIKNRIGQERWLSDTSIQVFDSAGSPTGSIGILQDITERKSVEEALRNSRARLDFLLSNTPAVIFTISPVKNYPFTFVSDSVRMLIGYEPHQYLENPDFWNSLIHFDDVDGSQSAFRDLLENGKTVWEHRIRHINGQYQWMSTGASILYDQQGQPIEIIGYSVNIDKQKQAQEALRENEEQNRLLFEESPDAIALLDEAGRYIRVNRAYEQLTQVHQEQLLARTADELGLITLETRTALQMATAQTLARQESFATEEFTLVAADGARRNVESRIFRLKIGGKNHLLVTARDISIHKKAEETLRLANDEMERAMRMKDEFLASMSHELRTPLTGILGLSEALQYNTYGDLTEKQLNALRNIETSGRHLLDLINDILDLSKIEAGKLDLQFEPCTLADVCHASLQLTKGMAHQKRQTVGYFASQTAVIIRADQRRLKQMLVNLLSNAIKFTPDGGALGLEVQLAESERMVRLIVWDRGPGISPEDLPRLFKPFIQLDNSLSRQQSGTGLGLSLVQKMAELHGGSVQVESTLGEGSRFTINLPWLPDTTQPLPATRRVTAPLRQVLLIEDNPLDVEQVSRYIRNIGGSTIVHKAAFGAVEKAAQTRPCVILLDLNLNNRSGFEVLSRLKTNVTTRNLPVIIISVEESRALATSLGAVGYLVKPFAEADLRAELERVRAFTNPTEADNVISGQSGPSILVVDDNLVILETIADFLTAQKYQVTTATGGRELLEIGTAVHPALIILDIQMPGMDGLEAIQRIRAHADTKLAKIPLIALTALTMPGDRERCLAAGANEYLSKPVELKNLLQTIERLLTEANLTAQSGEGF